jgi:putative (di)nucleoside polyphosphate hydrolase
MRRSLAGAVRAADHARMARQEPSLYRPNVAAVLRRSDGRVLIAQRSDYPDCWQFPQGGRDPGESPEDAARREIVEEVGISPEHYRIIKQCGPYRYEFPSGPDRRGFIGQEQIYFLCQLAEPEPEIDLSRCCGEFLAVRWVEIGGFPVHLAHPMKQDVYRSVLRDLLGDGQESH